MQIINAGARGLDYQGGLTGDLKRCRTCPSRSVQDNQVKSVCALQCRSSRLAPLDREDRLNAAIKPAAMPVGGCALLCVQVRQLDLQAVCCGLTGECARQGA